MISRALSDLPLPVYGDGRNVRDWLHVSDHVRGILCALKNGSSGNVYNFGRGEELSNLTVVQRILTYLKKPQSLVTFVSDRPGHDRRYAVDYSMSCLSLGWSPSPEHTLEATIQWYVDNPQWVQRVLSGQYRQNVPRAPWL